MDNVAVEATNLAKTYRSGKQIVSALKSISFQTQFNQVAVLLGPNGAGKTTLIRIVAGLLTPDSGSIMLDGQNIVLHPDVVREKCGFLFENVQNCYGYLTVNDNLRYFGFLKQIPAPELQLQINRLLQQFELEDKAHTAVNYLSHGMRRKLAVAIALLKQPKMLFLDEPTQGMDIFAQQQMKSFIKTWVRAEQRAILLTTHDLTLAQEVGDYFLFIHQGNLVWQGARDDLLQLNLPGAQYELVYLQKDGNAARAVIGSAELDCQLRRLHEQGCTIEAVNRMAPSLAAIFQELIKK